MKSNDRLQSFLQLQKKGIDIDSISKELGVATSTLRKFLNKEGYKLKGGKYILDTGNKEEQIKMNINVNKKNNKTTKTTKSTKTNKISNKISDLPDNKRNKQTKEKQVKVKKDRKINITQEDIDKLCEVYDWYLQVKDNKSMKIRKSNKKDINIDKIEIEEVKSTSVRIDKKTWEEFERMCSNSQFSKTQILTQALNEFMNQYKNLL